MPSKPLRVQGLQILIPFKQSGNSDTLLGLTFWLQEYSTYCREGEIEVLGRSKWAVLP
jgi:hypothetical protein